MRSIQVPMLDKVCNDVVRHVIARTGVEAARLIKSLPDTACKGLDADLSQCREAYRFDLSKESAYYFERQGNRLEMWSWQFLNSYDEIGELLSLVATLDEPITEEVANSLFEQVTNRLVMSPQPALQRMGCIHA